MSKEAVHVVDKEAAILCQSITWLDHSHCCHGERSQLHRGESECVLIGCFYLLELFRSVTALNSHRFAGGALALTLQLSDTTVPSVCALWERDGMLGLDGMDLFMHQQVL